MILVFSLSALWWRRIKGLWKLPDGRDCLRGKLDHVLLGKAVLSKSLIQFSFDGWSCVPSLLFTWGQTMLVKKTLYHLSHQGSQTMVEAMKILGTSFKRSHACTATLRAPNPAAGHHWPHRPPLETPGHSQASLGQPFVGSQLLSPGSWCIQSSVCALQESISQFYVSSGSSMVGLMVTSSKRAYSIPKSAAPRASVPVAKRQIPLSNWTD